MKIRATLVLLSKPLVMVVGLLGLNLLSACGKETFQRLELAENAQEGVFQRSLRASDYLLEVLDAQKLETLVQEGEPQWVMVGGELFSGNMDVSRKVLGEQMFCAFPKVASEGFKSKAAQGTYPILGFETEMNRSLGQAGGRTLVVSLGDLRNENRPLEDFALVCVRPFSTKKMSVKELNATLKGVVQMRPKTELEQKIEKALIDPDTGCKRPATEI